MSAAPPPFTLATKRACPFAERVRILLAHERIDHAIQEVDLSKRPDWFSAVSPLGKAPVLLVDAKVLFESLPIMEYLVETAAPTSRLRPDDPIERARMRAWMQFDETALVPAFYRMLAALGGPKEADARAQFSRLIAILDAELARRPGWLGGDEPNLADLTLATHALRLDILDNELGVAPPPLPPATKAWVARLAALPAVRANCASRAEMAADLAPYLGLRTAAT